MYICKPIHLYIYTYTYAYTYTYTNTYTLYGPARPSRAAWVGGGRQPGPCKVYVFVYVCVYVSADYGPWGPIIGCRTTDYGPWGQIISCRTADCELWGPYNIF